MAATMVSATCMVAAPVSSTFTPGQSLQSKSTFPVNKIIVSRKAPRSITVRASSEEAQPSKAAVFLSGVLGAAAAVSIGFSGDAIAALGPGNAGAQRTAEKADELLKSADALTTNESPPRFGPGRSAGDETEKLAQKAGSGANEALQGTQQKLETGAGAAKDAVAQAKSGASDVASKASDAADSKGGNLFSSIQGAFQNLSGSASSNVDDVASKAGSAVDDVKSQIPGQ